MLKPIAKKTGIIVLLLFAVLPLFCTLIFRVQQLLIRQRMKERLETQSLHRIILAGIDVHWIEEGKEIVIGGEMFDIKSYTFINGYYSFTGLFDKEETALVHQLEKTQQQTSSPGSKMLSQVFEWLQFVYHDPSAEDHFAVRNPNKQGLGIAPALAKQFMGIILPPPKED